MTREELQPYLDSLTTDEQRAEVAAFIDHRYHGKTIRVLTPVGIFCPTSTPSWEAHRTYSPIPPKPEPKLWHKFEHVKVGALFQLSSAGFVRLIQGVNSEGFWANTTYFRFASLTPNARWREVLPRDGAWLPCVAEEDGK